MFRWLLICLFAVQTSLPAKGACGADESRQETMTCCQTDHEPAETSCCHGHKGPSQADLPIQSDCGDQHPCCGCCHVAAPFLLFPQQHFQIAFDVVDHVDMQTRSLSGISHAPPTPPPNVNGVC